MSWVRDVFTVVPVCLGIVFFLAGTIGLLRFPDTLSRVHALTKADSLGAGLIVLGCALQTQDLLAALKLTIVWFLILLSSSAVGQLIALRTYHDSRRQP
jgi:multicomponent Na+:H+ antiporter subunit G